MGPNPEYIDYVPGEKKPQMCFGHPKRPATHIVKLQARRSKPACITCAENAKQIPNAIVKEI
jgi:hypothetical protein